MDISGGDLLHDAQTVPIALHPALAGAFYHSDGGIHERVVFGRLPRMVGADITIFFGPYGKYRLPEKSVDRIVRFLREPSSMRPSLPAIAAGIHPGQVHRLVERYGQDVVIAAREYRRAPAGTNGWCAGVSSSDQRPRRTACRFAMHASGMRSCA